MGAIEKGSDMSLNLRNAQRDSDGRLLVGEGGGNATAHYAGGNATSHEIPSFAVDIRREILVAIYDAGGGPLTRLDIAKATGRKKTPWLSNAIEDLVSQGYLTRLMGTWKNGCLMYWYEVAQ
jgi:hypothetical protein